MIGGGRWWLLAAIASVLTYAVCVGLPLWIASSVSA